jgi:hypothetical protein
MSRLSIVALAVAVVAACFLNAPTGAIAQSPPRPIDELAPPGRGLPPVLPDPGIPPEPTPSGNHFAGFQLVGFSEEPLAGNRGVLNMSRACALQYEHSRICTALEIMQTVETPEIPLRLRNQLAWVLSVGAERILALDAESPLPGRETQPVSDCRGWATDSPAETGLAIELGESPGCFGGFMPEPCDQELVVACCAMK